MLKLKYMEFEAIGRFVEKQRIDFTKLGSLVQVDGLNNNTGGSSGAAKSTIFNALDYLFGLNDKPTTVLQSRLTKDPMTVKAAFDFDGKELIISRGKKLSVDLDGNITTGSSKLTEEKLDEILGMPRDLFRQMLHKRQKEGGFFLKMTPKDVHEFLTSCLGLSAQAKKIDKIDIKIKSLTSTVLSVESSIKNVESAIEATNSVLTTLGETPKCSVDQASILRTKESLTLAEGQFAALQQEHKKQTDQLETERPQLTSSTFEFSEIDNLDKERNETRLEIQSHVDKERARQDEVKKWLADFKAELYRLHNQIAHGNTSKTEALSIAAEIRKIRAAICPTCDQTWVTEAAKVKENDLLKKLSTLKDIIDLGQKAGERNLLVSTEITRLEEEASPIQTAEYSVLITKEYDLSNQIRTLKRQEESAKEAERVHQSALHNGFALKQGKLRSAQSAELEQVRSIIETRRRVFDAGVHELRSHAAALAKHDANKVALDLQTEKYATQLANLISQLKNTKAELLIAEELKRGIKSYISCSFDDALVSIGDSATRIIRNIPNMANSTIRLVGTKETKEGKVKEEVNAIIDCDGDESIPLKAFSGGEESAIDIAVDLAVIDFVENRANKGIDIFILDEPFTGLDSVNIEQTLEVLKNANINKKLMIVDHNPVIAEFMSNKIRAVRTGTISIVEQ